jgi:hypothetical protein
VSVFVCVRVCYTADLLQGVGVIAVREQEVGRWPPAAPALSRHSALRSEQHGKSNTEYEYNMYSHTHTCTHTHTHTYTQQHGIRIQHVLSHTYMHTYTLTHSNTEYEHNMRAS